MQVLSVSIISIALSAATLSLVGCGEPDILNDSKADGAGGSDNPEPQCTDTETECGTACCDNETQVCNGGVCELKAETCEFGTTCEKGKVCDSEGECRDGCFINTKLYEHGDKNPSNPCESCEADSTTSWTPSAAVGSACGGDKFCYASGKCVGKCTIGGHVYETGQRNPSGTCEVCSVPNSTAWSQAASGDLCSDGGTVCRFDGKCVVAMSVATGRGHTCGVTQAGRAMCWGWGKSGQLGNGESADSTTPVGVSGLESGVVGIEVGFGHSCAIKASGEVMCWGDGSLGQLGDGTGNSHETPQLVVDLPFEAVSIAVGEVRTCAVLVDGTVMCWGWNGYGQLGDSTTDERYSPVQVVGLPSAVASISAGGAHTCAILEDSSLWCWGWNWYGQLGNGTTTNSSTPLRPKNLANNIVSVACGNDHTCAVSSDGVVRCWGSNPWGACGHPDGGSFLEPDAPVAGLPLDVVGITAGYGFSCAWTASGATMCWGFNEYGELGDNKTALRYTPDFVYGLNSGVRTVSTIGSSHACAIMQSGKVRCWGKNVDGQIGDGSFGAPHLIPTELTLFP